MKNLKNPALLPGLLLAYFFACPFLSAAQESKPHPIDAAMSKASEANPSTAGQTSAIREARKKWDLLLNRSYQKLIKNLDPAAAKALRESQRAWVQWRDKELKSLRAFYQKMEGTMYVPLSAYAEMNLTRQRALQLEKLAALADERETE